MMLLNCGVGEYCSESLGQQGRYIQSILNEISPEYSLEEWMLKLKLQYFDHMMQRADSLEKTLMLGKIEGRRKSYDQPRQYIQKQRHYFANKGPSSQGYGFPSSHVRM